MPRAIIYQGKVNKNSPSLAGKVVASAPANPKIAKAKEV